MVRLFNAAIMVRDFLVFSMPYVDMEFLDNILVVYIDFITPVLSGRDAKIVILFRSEPI